MKNNKKITLVNNQKNKESEASQILKFQKSSFSYFKTLTMHLLPGLIIAGLFSAALYVFATPPDSPYEPGEILNPTCAPGSTNCDINPPITSASLGAWNSKTYPTDAAGVLTNNGSGTLSWANSAAIASLNGLTGATQTFATGTTGTDFTISSAGTTHTFNLPTASAANRGLLSSADWNTFNNKQTPLTVNSPLAYGIIIPPVDVSFLVVAGGGGGASGGGGAGGVIYNSAYQVAVQDYSVSVGAGGTGGVGAGAAGSNGSNSSFASSTAIGGAAGAAVNSNGTTGGSGSGGGAGTSTTGGSGTAGQGNSGGGNGGYGSPYPSGGGGGAGAAGQSAQSTTSSGNGGDGVQNSITGTSIYYGGGGGGSTAYDGGGSGVGGQGGGGSGANNSTIPGGNGTNGSGGGGGGTTYYQPGGAGGSGAVIIRYITGTITATGGTITTSGSYTIHTFTSNGTFHVSAINSPSPVATLALGTTAVPTTADSLADVIWGASAATQKPLVLQGVSGQTADIFQTQNSTGTVLARIDASGDFTTTATGTFGSIVQNGNQVLDTSNIATYLSADETDPLSLHLDQTAPQTFTGGAVTGTGLLSVTSGQLGLDTSTYMTRIIADSPLAGSGTASSHLTVDLSSKQNASSALSSIADLTYSSGSPLVKMTAAGTFGLDTNIYLTTITGTNLDNVFSSNGLLKRTGAGTYTVDTNTYLTSASLGAWNSKTYPADAVGVLTNNGSGTLSWSPAGVTAFTGLSDAPSSYSGANAGDLLRINIGKTGLEFFTPSYLTSLSGALLLDQSTPQTFTGSGFTGSGLLKITSGTLGVDTSTYLTAVTGPNLDNVFSSNGLLKRTGAGTYTVDTNTYVTSAANPALSNLSDVAINTALLPGAFGTIDLGSASYPFGNLYLTDSNKTHYTEFTGGSQSANQAYTLPTAYPSSSGYILSSTIGGVMSWVANSSSQWTTSGSNIYYNLGNVGIGTANPSTKLTVAGGGVRIASDTSQVYDWSNAAQNAEYAYIGVTAAGGTPSSFNIGGNNIPIIFNSGSGGGSEYMRITSTGNVGIGTTNPVAKLHIVNGSASGYFDSEQTLAPGGAASTFQIMSGGNNKLSFGTNSNTRMTIDNNGLVGIGTTSPSYKLAVADSGGTGLNVNETASSGTAYGLVSWATGAATTNISGYFSASGATNNTGVDISGPSSGASNYALYSSATAQSYFAGNVGIGTTSPTSSLQVSAPSGGTNIRIGGYSAVGDTYSGESLVLGDNVMANQGAADGMVNINTHGSYAGSAIVLNGANGITFHTKSGSATAGAAYSSPVMQIDSSGRVGIGTTSPGAPLDVEKAGIDTVNVLRLVGSVDLSGNVGAALNIQGIHDPGLGSDYNFQVGKWNGSGYSNVNELNLNANGGVGIGTTSPSQKLDVNGNIQLDPSNPYIYSGGSYTVIPNGLFVSGGTAYFGNQIETRGGIADDTHSYLTISGGTPNNLTYFAGNVGINQAPSTSYGLLVSVAGTNVAISGYSANSGSAVIGSSSSGYGGYFTSSTSYGVYGSSGSSYGGYFYSTSGTGLYTTSCSGCSVVAEMFPVAETPENGDVMCTNSKTGKTEICKEDKSSYIKGIAQEMAESIMRMGCSKTLDSKNGTNGIAMGVMGTDNWKNLPECKGWYPIALSGLSEQTNVVCTTPKGVRLGYGDILVTSSVQGRLRPLDKGENVLPYQIAGKASSICAQGKATDSIQVLISQ